MCTYKYIYIYLFIYLLCMYVCRHAQHSSRSHCQAVLISAMDIWESKTWLRLGGQAYKGGYGYIAKWWKSTSPFSGVDQWIMKPNVPNSLKCHWMPPITTGHHLRNQATKTMAFSTGRNRPQQSPQTISFRSRWREYGWRMGAENPEWIAYSICLL